MGLAAAPLNAHRHVHYAVIDGVFESATTGGIMFTAATELDAIAIAKSKRRYAGA